MRHMVVRRTATVLGAVLIACALLFGLVASRRTVPRSATQDATSSGAAAFRRYCASCHTVQAIRPSIVSVPVPLSVAPDELSNESKCAESTTYSFGSCVPLISAITL